MTPLPLYVISHCLGNIPAKIIFSSRLFVEVQIMLFLVTFLVCLHFAHFHQLVPSAHLEGGDPGAKHYAKNQVLATWNPYHPNSYVMDGFVYEQGRLRVPMDGRYNVYLQIFFNWRPRNTSNRVAVYAGNRKILMIHKDMRARAEESAFASGVFRLKRGEMIYVKVIGYSTKMWMGPNHCYFGVYLVASNQSATNMAQ